MEEIKKRTEVIRGFLDGTCNAMYRQTLAECVSLQVRKILELIALASLVASKDEYAKKRANFHKDWHAKRILQSIEEVNPLFYPKPTKQIVNAKNQKVEKVEEIDSGFLTRTEFERIYDRCGGLLHAQNPFSSPKDIDSFLRVVPSWMDKIMTLLNHHQVQLAQSDLQIWVLMKSKTDGRPQVTLFKRMEENA